MRIILLRSSRSLAVAFVALLVPVALIACATTPRPDAAVDADVRELAGLMIGWFDSAEQSEADPDHFFDIRLVMLPIWRDRVDGIWLYVEQAAASALDRPYRQRVYHLRRTDTGDLVSDVYALGATPLDHAGAWRRDGALDRIEPDDLELRDGCSIILRPTGDGGYVGGTTGDGCSSGLGDAAYATSEVTIESGRLMSWDRGWTSEGVQAWGATEGAYIFVKRGDGPPG